MGQREYYLVGIADGQYHLLVLETFMICLINMNLIFLLLERRVNNCRAQRISGLGNYDGFVAMEAHGFVGGIWCFGD